MPPDEPGQQPAAGGSAEHPAGNPPAGNPPAGGNPPPAGQPPAGGQPAPQAPWWDAEVKEEPVREYLKAKDYKTPGEAARAAWNLNRILNVQPDIQAVFEGKATPEQEKNFYAKLGRPETPDKYDLKPGEGVQVDENLTKLGKEIFFDLGANPAKAQAAFEKWNKAVIEMNTQQAAAEKAANDEALAALDKKWGGKSEAMKAAGLRVLNSLKLSGDEMANIEKHIGSAAIVDLLARIGSMSAEAGFKGGNEGNPDPNNVDALTIEQAKARVAQLQADEAFQNILRDKRHPERAAKLELWERVNAKANSKPGAA